MISATVKACGPCARAKRKCGKQLPACERCVRQRLDCNYPPPGAHAQRQQSVQPPRPSISYQSPAVSHTTDESNSFIEEPLVGGRAGAALSPATPSTLTWNPEVSTNDGASPSLSDAQSAWFLTPETWEIVKLHTIPNRPIRPALFEEFVATLQSWLADWAKNGCSAFIHRELYASRVPGPIGDAFTTLTSYFHRTPATEPMVFRIMEDRITNLATTEALEPPSVLGHLSRVHALMAYSIICLFHGDIRLRRVAEVNLPVLVSWCQEMLQATARAASDGQLIYSEMVNALAFLGTDPSAGPLPPLHELNTAWQQLGEAEKETSLWHTWVVTESVRRAWVTARGVETIYLTLRDRAAACPGGLVFTMSKSVWEANSALAWAKACAESDTGFLHIWDTQKLCIQPTSDAMDAFAKVMIKLNFRTDRACSWVRGEDGGPHA